MSPLDNIQNFSCTCKSDDELEEIVIKIEDDNEEKPVTIFQIQQTDDIHVIDVERLQHAIDVDIDDIYPDVNSTDETPSIEKRSLLNKQKSNIYKKSSLCCACGKLVPNVFMAKHLLSHQHNQCNFCSETFETYDELQKHKSLHSPKEYTCDICKEGYDKSYDFAVHNFKHIKTYACPMCSFQTKGRSSLKGHIKRHEGEFTFFCSVCSRGFITKALLTTHEEIHLDIKKYECEICEKKFTVKRYLDVHRQLNHRKELFGVETLYKCEYCHKTFTFEKSLKRHKSVIHHIGEDRTVRCKVCDKLIANKYNLKIHMRIHTGEKRYCCELCGKAFSEFKYWKKHKVIHENQRTEPLFDGLDEVLLPCYDLKTDCFI